jgi:protein-tyrosine phosphatase
MPSVLFVCLANRFRSPLVAAFFSHMLEQEAKSSGWIVSSAGTWTESGLPADNRAIKDAHDLGFDIRSHRSRQVDADILAQNDLVLVMEAGQKEALQIEFPKERKKIFLLSEMLDGLLYDIPDPFGLEGFPHQEIAAELFDLTKRGFKNIFKMALDLHNSSS